MSHSNRHISTIREWEYMVFDNSTVYIFFQKKILSSLQVVNIMNHKAKYMMDIQYTYIQIFSPKRFACNINILNTVLNATKWQYYFPVPNKSSISTIYTKCNICLINNVCWHLCRNDSFKIPVTQYLFQITLYRHGKYNII